MVKTPSSDKNKVYKLSVNFEQLCHLRMGQFCIRNTIDLYGEDKTDKPIIKRNVINDLIKYLSIELGDP